MDGAQARGEAGVAVEEGAPCELRPSPEERASWPSYLWWCWLSPLMAEGHKRPLQVSSLPEDSHQLFGATAVSVFQLLAEVWRGIQL